MKEVMKNERLVIAIAAVVLVVVAVVGVLAARQTPTVIQQDGSLYGRPMMETKPVLPEPEPAPVEPEPTPEPSPEPEPKELTQANCESAGGTWNECGSACRGAPPGTMCIMMCVPYCECTSDDQCPTDTSCTAYIEGTGVCE